MRVSTPKGQRIGGAQGQGQMATKGGADLIQHICAHNRIGPGIGVRQLQDTAAARDYGFIVSEPRSAAPSVGHFV
jgi:hypothetical protein